MQIGSLDVEILPRGLVNFALFDDVIAILFVVVVAMSMVVVIVYMAPLVLVFVVMVVVVMMVVLLVGCWSSHAVCHGVGHELQEDLQKILGSTLKLGAPLWREVEERVEG